jgi:hypothetical protein
MSLHEQTRGTDGIATVADKLLSFNFENADIHLK